jgi:uncharacterized protein YndB with AHSA1/START domain
MIDIAPVRKQIIVNATPGRAFEVFTTRMSAWWPATHSILSSPLKECVIEPRVGGRWYSVGEDGSTCQSGHVIAWQPPERLVLAWQITPEWKFDPELVTEVEVRFVAMGATATRVELTHRNLERMGPRAPDARALIDAPKGWGAILESFKILLDHEGEGR